MRKPSIKRKKLMNKTEDRIEQKKVSYFNKVIKGYLQIAKNNKNRFVVIDGTKPIQEIHSEIISVIKSKVKI